ncbi:MAG: DNA repair protein RecN [Clostridiales bacterium]|nr:DNA repair protein RecN [Clostridiales bacterium]
MLCSLHVKNFAIIDEVEVFFQNHLNIMTGETGAGKSILIDSINFALGGKATKDIIRKNAEFALVELIFQTDRKEVFQIMEKNDIGMQDDQIVISRKILQSGRSIYKINGENAPTQIVKNIAGYLLDIHGQHEHQSLLYKHVHLNMVDRFAKEEAFIYKESIAKLYQEYSKLKEELNSAEIDEDKRLRELSFLEYEMKEIEDAKLKVGEDEILQSEYKRLSNAANILESLSVAYSLTSEENDSAANNVSRAVKQLQKVSNYDEKLNGLLLQMNDIESLLNDFNRDVSEYMDHCSDSREELEQVEERLNLINHLKAKYGNRIEDILTYYKKCEEKKFKYEAYDEYLTKLTQKIKIYEEKLNKECEQLSVIRQQKAKILTERLIKALVDLNFLDVQFEIQFTRLKDFTWNGFDEAEFMISTNPGEPMRSLAKVASGGELSRIMLAIKSVMAKKDDISTLIFDEIDVGISGRTAQKVSEKLGVLAKEHQILCITHLPQIAAMADTHYVIEKQTDGLTTHTNIRQLKEEEAISELARILGGAKITENVLNSAKEMKALAYTIKSHGNSDLIS